MADPTMQEVLAAIGGLAKTVEALSERVAHIADTPSVPTVVDPDFVPFVMTQESSYAPLVPTNDDNELRRFKLAQALGILHEPSGRELLEHGARGFWRKLDLGDQLAYEVIPRPIAVSLVMDAELEDPHEAQSMGAELLPMLSCDNIMAGPAIDVRDGLPGRTSG